MRHLLLATSALLLVFAIPCAHAERAYVPLEQRLSTDQLKATGLDQLAPEQMTLLNSLLKDERAADFEAIRADAKHDDEKNREPIVSKIVGDFVGWSYSSTFKLTNGQTWRVVNTPDYYVAKSKAQTNPAVSITPGMFGGWSLQVEGHSVRAKVSRVK